MIKFNVAGLIFQYHPPNFENQYNFWRFSIDAKTIFFSTGFRVSKICVEFLSISVAVLAIVYFWWNMIVEMDTQYKVFYGHSVDYQFCRIAK